jgi:hypothetical protein
MGYKESVRRFQVEYWERLFKQHGGNVTKVAQASEMNRTAVHRIIINLGLKEIKKQHFDKRFVYGQGKGRLFARQYRLPMKYPIVGEG